jgi:peroxiredoxin
VAWRLIGAPLPDLSLPSTAGGAVALARLATRTVLYVYPMTGKPGVSLPDGWELLPGARGCTAEACAFRDHHAELQSAKADVVGLSSQSRADQQEAVTRLRLPFPLLSDVRLELARVLRLPTFAVNGRRLYQRLTLVTSAGVIAHVFFPVYEPERHAERVLAWLLEHPQR